MTGILEYSFTVMIYVLCHAAVGVVQKPSNRCMGATAEANPNILRGHT